jgi:MFS family permease
MSQTAAPREPEVSAPPAPAARTANYALGALFVLYIFNFADRQLLSLFVQPIKDEFQVSDFAMGMLAGPAFAVFYTLAGFPLARWADRGSRVMLISLGLVAWSGMTALSGLVRGYGQMLAARIGVGVGEASFTPSAHSLLTDYFPVHRRATALAIFAAGAGVGNVIGYAGGGVLAEAMGWRSAFLLLGSLGLPVALLFYLTVGEPPRFASAQQAAAAGRDSARLVVRYLFSRPAFTYLALAASLHGFSSYGSSAWTAAFFMRVHELTLAQTGLLMAVVSGIASVVGQISAGFLADRIGRRDVRWYMIQPAITSVLSLPLLVGFLWLEDLRWALWFYVPASLISSMWTGPTYAMAQSLARPHMRAMASALIVFLLNLIGMGLGPLLVGGLNDLLEPALGLEAVRYSLMGAAVPHALAAIFNLLSIRTLKQDLEAAQK